MTVQPTPGDVVPVFYGTLGDTRQDPADQLPAPLAALRKAHAKLMTDYARGAIDRTTLALRLSSLVYTATDGTVWTVGASSSHFYVRPNGRRNWELAGAPTEASWEGAVAASDRASSVNLTVTGQQQDQTDEQDQDPAPYIPGQVEPDLEPQNKPGHGQTPTALGWDTTQPDPDSVNESAPSGDREADQPGDQELPGEFFTR